MTKQLRATPFCPDPEIHWHNIRYLLYHYEKNEVLKSNSNFQPSNVSKSKKLSASASARAKFVLFSYVLLHFINKTNRPAPSLWLLWFWFRVRQVAVRAGSISITKELQLRLHSHFGQFLIRLESHRVDFFRNCQLSTLL